MKQIVTGNNNFVIGGSMRLSSKDTDRIREGNGKIKSECRELPSFTKIKLKGSINVVYSCQSEPVLLKVTADSNLLELVSTKVKNDTLIVKTKGSFSTHNKIEVECSSNLLAAIVLEGSGDIEASHISTDTLEVCLNGSGDVMVEGKCEIIRLSLEGSGDIDCRNLEAQKGHVNLLGSGDIRAFIRKSAECSLIGSGDIKVTGNPQQKSKSKTGSGSIKIK